MDLVAALCVAAFLFFISAPHRRPLPAVYVKASRWVASFSFSLYVIHLPVLVFSRSQISPEQVFAPTIGTVGLALVIFSFTVILGYIFFWLAEQHTPALRALLKRVLSIS
jgi:peptidoglycan/LPS O-acetylase OafA/YrhL